MPENTILGNVTSDVISDQQFEYMRLISQIMQDRKRGDKPVAYIRTYGCQQNVADSERIKGMLEIAGFEFSETVDDADFILFNTCAIREHAEDRVFGNVGALKSLKRKHPQIVIALCGCMMEQEHIANKMYKSFPFVSLVFGTHSLHRFPQLLYHTLADGKRVYERDNDDKKVYEGIPVKRDGTFKGWLSIMYGCNNFCTYCIIPYARGRVRSMPLNAAVEQARGLAAEGYREIVINGIEISSWGWEWKNGSCLRQLLAALCEAVPGIRIRLGSLEPRTIDEAFCKTLSGYANLCPQFHLSLQSGSDTVLKRMHRKYDTARYLESVRLLRKYFPGCAVTTDLIVGFPGETEEEFAESLEFLKTCGLSMFHIFPYSRRKGTPAADMPDQIPNAVKERRAAEAASAAAELEAAYHASMLGTTQQVLFEQEENGLYAGHAMNYVKVYVQAAQLHNELRAVRVTDLCRDGVFGELE